MDVTQQQRKGNSDHPKPWFKMDAWGCLAPQGKASFRSRPQHPGALCLLLGRCQAAAAAPSWSLGQGGHLMRYRTLRCMRCWISPRLIISCSTL